MNLWNQRKCKYVVRKSLVHCHVRHLSIKHSFDINPIMHYKSSHSISCMTKYSIKIGILLLTFRISNPLFTQPHHTTHKIKSRRKEEKNEKLFCWCFTKKKKSFLFSCCWKDFCAKYRSKLWQSLAVKMY